LRRARFDSATKPAKFSDHFSGALLLGLFGDGWAAFFVTNSLVQDQPNQSALSTCTNTQQICDQAGQLDMCHFQKGLYLVLQPHLIAPQLILLVRYHPP
jgi:hypothetical protein